MSEQCKPISSAAEMMEKAIGMTATGQCLNHSHFVYDPQVRQLWIQPDGQVMLEPDNLAYDSYAVEVPERLWNMIRATRKYGKEPRVERQYRLESAQGLVEAANSMKKVSYDQVMNRAFKDLDHQRGLAGKTLEDIAVNVYQREFGSQQAPQNGTMPDPNPAVPSGPLHTPVHKTVHPPVGGMTSEQGFPNKPKLPKFF